MNEFADHDALMKGVKRHLHGEILRLLTETGLSNEEVSKVTGLRFDRHKRYKLREGPEAVSWSSETFVHVARCLGLPIEVEVRVGGTAFVQREKGKATSARRPGSAIRSPALAA